MSNVVSLEEYKRKVTEKELLVRKRDPVKIDRGDDFPTRQRRVQESLERIRALLGELKAKSDTSTDGSEDA